MAFNGCCTGNDMKYSSEGQKLLYDNFKLSAPKSSYGIIDTDKSSKIKKVNYMPTKQTCFNKDNIPKWIEFNFYSIPKSGGKRLISLHIINKCLTSKDPYLKEPNLILYCHENETDLLRLAPFFIDLSVQMKCDILSFDYWGFGCSSGKPKINTILTDAEEVLNFSISYLNYKIDNIILFGNGIGATSSIYLSSRHNFQNCQALILYMPKIGKKIIDVKAMRSIVCQTLLIIEFEDKVDTSKNEVINLCREIPNEKEWFPIRKRAKDIKNNFFGQNSDYNDSNDIYIRHRSKFITKVKDYILIGRDMTNIKKHKDSTVGGSTDSGSNIDLQENPLSLGNSIKNNNIADMNFEDKENLNKEDEVEEGKFNKNDELAENEIRIDNDEDY